MTIEQMRSLLGLGPEFSDEEVIAAYGQYEREAFEAEAAAALADRPFDPWRAAIDLMFEGPGSEPAQFESDDEEPRPIRVIRRGPDRLTRYGDTQILPATHIIDVRVSDVPAPAVGNLFTIYEREFAISVDPILDVEGLTWTCGAEVLA